MNKEPNKNNVTGIIITIATTILVSPLVIGVVSGAWRLGEQYGNLEQRSILLEEEIRVEFKKFGDDLKMLGNKAQKLDVEITKADLKLKILKDCFPMKISNLDLKADIKTEAYSK